MQNRFCSNAILLSEFPDYPVYMPQKKVSCAEVAAEGKLAIPIILSSFNIQYAYSSIYDPMIYV